MLWAGRLLLRVSIVTAIIHLVKPQTAVQDFFASLEQDYVQDRVLPEFEAFQIKYFRIYNTTAEEEYRLMVFACNLMKIDRHNSILNRTFDMGVTFYTDYTPAEFIQILATDISDDADFGVEDTSQNEVSGPAFGNPGGSFQASGGCQPCSPVQSSNNGSSASTGSVSPDTVDYTQDPCIGPVENQLSCGSCWAFSTTQIAGWLYCKNNGGNYVTFSKQQLIDCSTENQGCVNGYTKKAAKYIAQNGITTEADYPYISAQETCQLANFTDTSNFYFPINGTKNVKKNDEGAMLTALKDQGPLLIVIDGTNLAFYKKGIITGDSCNHGVVNHAVILVGKIVERDGAWKIKNHWGTDWGEDGYVYLEANNQADKGCLGVAGYPSYVF